MFHGTPSPGGIVQAIESEGMPGHVSLRTVTFAEREGTTWLTENTIYQSVEDRDRCCYMARGRHHKSIERLAQLLAQLTWRADTASVTTEEIPAGMRAGVTAYLHTATTVAPGVLRIQLICSAHGQFSGAGPPLLSRLPRR